MGTLLQGLPVAVKTGQNHMSNTARPCWYTLGAGNPEGEQKAGGMATGAQIQGMQNMAHEHPAAHPDSRAGQGGEAGRGHESRSSSPS
jgi:hypothetical protein